MSSSLDEDSYAEEDELEEEKTSLRSFDKIDSGRPMIEFKQFEDPQGIRYVEPHFQAFILIAFSDIDFTVKNA